MRALLVLVLAVPFGSPRAAFAERASVARAALHAGKAAYDRFAFEEAIVQLTRAIEARGDEALPESLLAHCYLFRGLSRYTLAQRREADEDIRTALRRDPHLELPADLSPKISARIASLRREVDAGRATRAIVPGRPQERPAAQKPRGRLWTWITLVASGTALATGAGLGISALALRSEFENEAYAGEALRIGERAEAQVVATNVLFATGAALLVTSALLYWLEPRRQVSGAAPTALAPAQAPWPTPPNAAGRF